MTTRAVLIADILKRTPYLPTSDKYKELGRNLASLNHDTLFILRQSQAAPEIVTAPLVRGTALGTAGKSPAPFTIGALIEKMHEEGVVRVTLTVNDKYYGSIVGTLHDMKTEWTPGGLMWRVVLTNGVVDGDMTKATWSTLYAHTIAKGEL